MKKQTKNIVLCVLMLAFLVGMGGWLLLKTPDEFSDSERRTLVRKIDFRVENVLNGKFMTGFEEYALDQFPLRDSFRSIKAISEYYVFQKKDSNEIVFEEGYLSKMEYPLNETLLNQSLERITGIYERYLKDTEIKPYLVIVPDKNYYMAKENQILTMDYDKLYETVFTQLDYMNYIEIRDYLELKDYYYTDTHWKQEAILDVAEGISKAMGYSLDATYETKTLDIPFNGVYVGQAALPVKPDELKYLTNDMLEHCIVTNYDTGKAAEGTVYNRNKAAGKDSYEMFLEGASAVLVIENKEAKTENELVIFRDSFGSSLTPLLVENYHKITLVDLRYIRNDLIGTFVEFGSQDVIFMYSTLLLNNGLGGGN